MRNYDVIEEHDAYYHLYSSAARSLYFQSAKLFFLVATVEYLNKTMTIDQSNNGKNFRLEK